MLRLGLRIGRALERRGVLVREEDEFPGAGPGNRLANRVPITTANRDFRRADCLAAISGRTALQNRPLENTF